MEEEIILILIVLTFFEFLFQSQPTIPRKVNSEKMAKVRIVKKSKLIVLLIVPTTNFNIIRQYIGTKALKYKNIFFTFSIVNTKPKIYNFFLPCANF